MYPGQQSPRCNTCHANFGGLYDQPCIRHGCTRPGCNKPRVVPTYHLPITWHCQEHYALETATQQYPDLDLVIKFLELNPDSSAADSTPSTTVPTVVCDVCIDGAKGITRNNYPNSKLLCSRHRCTFPGCTWPRSGQYPNQGRCSGHNKMDSPNALPGDPNETVPPTTKRHSRMRSLFHWKSFGKSRRDSRIEATYDTLITPNAEKTQTDPQEVMPSQVIPPPAKPPPIDAHPFVPQSFAVVNWHQCHAPACQDRVISEDIWVCQKHLEQGFYELDDPPGFMDAK